jgi:cytochrome P450
LVNGAIPVNTSESAGSDTTASAMGTFFLAMVCYPEVQKEAQTELDNVLNGRLPEHSDVFSLPYLSAVVKEVLRYAAICSLLQEFISSC